MQNKRPCSFNKKSKAPNYKDIFQFPPKLVSKDFSIWVSSNDVNIVRFGVIVTKKNIKLAVNRNKSKRLARGLFKEFGFKFNNKDLVLVIKNFESANRYIWKKKLLEAYKWLEHFT